MAPRSRRHASVSLIPLQRIPARERFAWTEELECLLGKIPDSQVARKAGVDRDTVAEERLRRGIESWQPRQIVEWTPEMIAVVGTESDRKVARELKLSRSAVREKREALGIAAFHPPPYEPVRSFYWEAQDLALLGKMPDKVVAKQLGIGVMAVARERRQLKIPPFRPKAPIVEWTPEMLELLGKVSDRKAAELLGISMGTVIRKRKRLGIRGLGDRGKVVPTSELTELLRDHDATEVRRRTGLVWQTIRALRAKLGLPAPETWTPEVLARLGREPDQDLPVPETDYTFAELIRAQADGDRKALEGRRVMRVNLGGDVHGGLARLREALGA